MRFFILQFIVVTALASSGCSSSPDLETATKFQNAEQQFEAASSEEDYVKVAALYQEMIDSGFVSGSLLYNQGNAWMQAGKPGHAIASYRQATHQIPRDPYLQSNLKQALTGQDSTPRKPLLDYLFFWQTSVSYREKGVAVTGLLAAVLLIGVAINFNFKRTILRRVNFLLIGLLVLMALSLARDWFNIEYTRHGVVVVDDCMARKGGSESYDPAFKQTLREGLEFTVIRELNGWLNIQLAESGECWIPKTASVTYP